MLLCLLFCSSCGLQLLSIPLAFVPEPDHVRSPLLPLGLYNVFLYWILPVCESVSLHLGSFCLSVRLWMHIQYFLLWCTYSGFRFYTVNLLKRRKIQWLGRTTVLLFVPYCMKSFYRTDRCEFLRTTTHFHFTRWSVATRNVKEIVIICYFNWIIPSLSQ